MELNRDLYIDGVSDYLENGKNIFDKGSQYVYRTIINPITITEQNTGIKIEYTATDIFSGAFVLYNLGLASKYAGKSITCSANAVLNSNTRGKLTIGLISNDGSTRNILQNGEEITSNTEGYSVSATIPSTISSSTPYLGVWVYFNNNATGSVSIEYSNLQVEEGLGATSYEPHKKYVTKDYLEDGKQLFNKDTTRDGYGIVKSSGAITAENTQCYSDFIPAKANTSYAFNINFSSNNFGVTFYNSSRTYLSGLSYNEIGNEKTFTTPANTAYIIMTIKIANKDTFMLNKGTSATPYEEYYGKYITENYLKNGKNKANIPTHTVAGQGTDYRIVNIEQNTTYTLSCLKTRISGVTITNGSLIMFVKFDFYNGSTKISSASLPSAVSFTTGSRYLTYTFTTPANCDNILLNLGNNNGDNNRNTSVSNVMLNKGTSALPYEEYYGKYLNKADIIKNGIEDYSTNETRIGTWIDGKPLYRKVFTGTLSSGAYRNITSSSNIKKIIDAKGYMLSDNVGYTLGKTIYSGESDLKSATRVIVLNNNLRLDADYAKWGAATYEIAVEYTKTTD